MNGPKLVMPVNFSSLLLLSVTDIGCSAAPKVGIEILFVNIYNGAIKLYFFRSSESLQSKAKQTRPVAGVLSRFTNS